MTDQKNDLPKVPPFIIKGTSGKAIQEPVSQPRNNNRLNKRASQLGMFSSLILFISVISMGVAMLSGAWFAYSVLGPEPNSDVTSTQDTQPQDNSPSETTNPGNDASNTVDNQNDVLYKVIVVGLAYFVGWIFSVIGVRIFGNLILPYAIRIYAWVVLAGILLLQVLIMSRLYQQEYHFSNYVKYLSVFGAGLIALVGLHLILEKHSLIPFGVFILLTSLVHLYSIVYHYIFVPDVIHEMLWGDIIFFFVTTLVSILMLAHFGLLNGMRRLIDRMFNPKNNQFVPPA